MKKIILAYLRISKSLKHMGPQTLSHTSTKEAVNTDVCKKDNFI